MQVLEAVRARPYTKHQTPNTKHRQCGEIQIIVDNVPFYDKVMKSAGMADSKGSA